MRIVSLSFFEEGERLFLENKPAEALEMLEAALAEGSENEKLYLYLGIIYEQLGMHEKAVSIMEVGLKITEDRRDKFLFNIGNNLFAQDKKEQAEQRYSDAIDTNGSMAEAYLNRANTRVALEKYPGAVDDYTAYLSLRPSAPQKEKIEKMIDLLKQSIAAKQRKEREEELRRIEEERKRKEEEQRRLEEERERQEEEARRKEEERKRKEEEERRKEEERRRQEALLEEVLNSLESSSEDTTSKSADSEDIEDLDLDLELEE